MSVKESVSQLQHQIERILSRDTSTLYKKGANWQPWNGIDSNGLDQFVNATLDTLRKLSDNTALLDTAGKPEIDSLIKNVTSLDNELENLETMGINNISNQHHRGLNIIHQINNRLRLLGFWLKLESFPEVSKLETYLAQTEDARNKARIIADEVEEIKNKAKKDLSDKVKIDLIQYLNEQYITYRNFSYAIIFLFGIVLSAGFLFIVHPIWDSFQDFLLGKGNENNLARILIKIPIGIIYVTILYILVSFYKRYETLALVMNHKVSVAKSLSHYSEVLFEETEKVAQSNRDILKQKVVEFEIQTLTSIFEQPAVNEKMLNMQAGVSEKGLNFSIGDGKG